MKKRTDVNNKCHIEIKHSHWGGGGEGNFVDEPGGRLGRTEGRVS